MESSSAQRPRRGSLQVEAVASTSGSGDNRRRCKSRPAPDLLAAPMEYANDVVSRNLAHAPAKEHQGPEIGVFTLAPPASAPWAPPAPRRHVAGETVAGTERSSACRAIVPRCRSTFPRRRSRSRRRSAAISERRLETIGLPASSGSRLDGAQAERHRVEVRRKAVQVADGLPRHENGVVCRAAGRRMPSEACSSSSTLRAFSTWSSAAIRSVASAANSAELPGRSAGSMPPRSAAHAGIEIQQGCSYLRYAFYFTPTANGATHSSVPCGTRARRWADSQRREEFQPARSRVPPPFVLRLFVPPARSVAETGRSSPWSDAVHAA